MGSATTFAGAVRKNKLIKYLEQVADHQFLTLVNGSTINEMEFERAVTQVSQAEPVLTAGAEFQGRNDRYHLLSSLGEGAVGKVWRARSSETGQLVAVKVMLPRQDLLDPRRLPDVERRFEREGRNGLKLSHRALVPHLDIGSWNGRRFIVLALARESVKDKLIAGSGKMPLKETIPIIQAAVDALSYLHSKKCIHRDVKPSNMLLLGSAYVLSDLGVVRWSDLNPEFTEAGTITNESIQLGSLRYMAPEQQVSSHEAVAQSDVYALGMTWYELLTGSTIPAAQAAVGDFAPPTGNSRAAETIRAMFAVEPVLRHDKPFAVRMTARLARQKGGETAEWYPSNGRALPKNWWLRFKMEGTTVPPPYEVWWRVTNHGREARDANGLRGQAKCGTDEEWESTLYRGHHYMECEIRRNGIVLASARHVVNIK